MKRIKIIKRRKFRLCDVVRIIAFGDIGMITHVEYLPKSDRWVYSVKSGLITYDRVPQDLLELILGR